MLCVIAGPSSASSGSRAFRSCDSPARAAFQETSSDHRLVRLLIDHYRLVVPEAVKPQRRLCLWGKVAFDRTSVLEGFRTLHLYRAKLRHRTPSALVRVPQRGSIRIVRSVIGPMRRVPRMKAPEEVATDYAVDVQPWSRCATLEPPCNPCPVDIIAAQPSKRGQQFIECCLRKTKKSLPRDAWE